MRKFVKKFFRALCFSLFLVFSQTSLFFKNFEVLAHQKEAHKSLQDEKIELASNLYMQELSFFELNELKQNHPERLLKKPEVFKNLNVVTSGDIDKDADVMFEKVKAFLESVGTLNKENYISKVREFLSVGPNGSKQIATASAQDFNSLESNPNYCIAYRGVSKKDEAERLRGGVVSNSDLYLVSDKHVSSAACSGFYTAPFYTRASVFVDFCDKDGFKNGEVVKFAIHKDAKIIDQNYLEDIFKRMIERHSDYSYFKELSNLFKVRGDYFEIYNSNFDYFVNFVKEKTGFDFFADVDTKPVKERFEAFGMNLAKILGMDFTGERVALIKEENLTDEQRQAREQFDDILYNHPCFGFGLVTNKYDRAAYGEKCRALDPLPFNFVLYLMKNQALLTKVYGYDAHVWVNDDFNLAREEELAKKHNSFFQVPGAGCDLTNFEHIIVCSDEFKPQEKLGLNSPLGFLETPRMQLASEVNSKLQPYSGDINADAEIMFEKVKEFLEAAEKDGISEKQLDDYSRKYIKQHVNSGCEKLSVASPEWFENIENNPDWLVLYRGISHKPFAESVRRGDVYIGGPLRGVNYVSNLAEEGNGIMLTSVFEHAKYWAKIPDIVHGDKNQEFGEVVKFALPKNSKIVSCKYIYSVFEKMLEKHPDYEPFKKHFELKKVLGDSYLNNSASFKVTNEFVKKKTGFDFFADADKKSLEERSELFEKAVTSLGLLVPEDKISKPIDEVFSDDQKKLADEFLELAKSVGYDMKEGDYLIDKIYFLGRNYGLLAKLMGFDVVYRYYPGVRLHRPEEYHGYFCDAGGNPEVNCLNVVDYSNLYVCSEPACVDAKIRHGEVILL